MRAASRALLLSLVVVAGCDGESEKAAEEAQAPAEDPGTGSGEASARDVLEALDFFQQAEQVARRAAVRTLLALRIHETRHGELPPRLATVVEERILPALPTDPYSGRKLRYSRTRRLLWSVGPDGKDGSGEMVNEAGDPVEDSSAARDRVWRILPR